MRVSVTLHTQQPDENGNQRDYEARYQGFNRQYADLQLDQNGDGFLQVVDLTFPNCSADPEMLTWFSIGICVAPSNQGGSIIGTGPLEKPINVKVGTSPQLTATVGVYKARLDAMRADGRLVDNVAPDPARGINLTQ